MFIGMYYNNPFLCPALEPSTIGGLNWSGIVDWARNGRHYKRALCRLWNRVAYS